ncbi:putative membrane protein [Mucilaginibacter gracilis]|uniref:Putative membrane protein n=1 Tax=Mucilaginibacter gracilis TaxID=423350 RepID=A0A495ITG0_9SPHI|nr:c-type cytochrome domain-containing protein [Mucilaginibacter gracilis]RKR79950.1 putative membrane protein [Mucilaginibacter gracilis]
MPISTILLTADWGSFIGHLHPVIVHLPIGMLIVAAMLEALAMRKRTIQWDQVIVLILRWGCLSALVSAAFGWLLSRSGGYPAQTLFWHQWAGISLVFIAGVCSYLKVKAIASKSNTSYRIAMLVMLLLLTFTGHLGGNMTHGEGYLTADLPEPLRSWLGMKLSAEKNSPEKISDVNEARVYRDVISPILQSKCWSCHGESKSKGNFRMDTETLLMKGGEHGAVILKNHADGSELVKRVLLPPDDDHRMPPKGKEALTDNEISMIKWWINHGADFTKKLKELHPDEKTKQLFSTLNGNSQTLRSPGGGAGSKPYILFNQKAPLAARTDIDTLKKLFVLVSPIAQAQNYLSVSCINAPGFDDSKMALLVRLSPQITWLRLSHTKITDTALPQLSKMTSLTRLDMAYTNLTDAGIQSIARLPNLVYLNLTGTRIDDQGLKQLAPLKNLRNIYCWRTAVSKEGVAILQKKIPWCNIDTGAKN